MQVVSSRVRSLVQRVTCTRMGQPRIGRPEDSIKLKGRLTLRVQGSKLDRQLSVLQALRLDDDARANAELQVSVHMHLRHCKVHAQSIGHGTLAGSSAFGA